MKDFMIKLRQIPGVYRFRSYYSSLSEQGLAITFEQHGLMDKVLKLKSYIPKEPNSNEVTIQFLASPINPSDVNQVEGVYPVPAKQVENVGFVAGNEGVAKVIKIGNQVNDFKIGDNVIPIASGFGTWRNLVTTETNKLLKLPNYSNVSIEQMATLSVNPSTAFRMLKDFEKLNTGDTILQNASNSEVGKSVIRLCHHWGLNSINIIRERPDSQQLNLIKDELYELGASLVLTDKELGSYPIKQKYSNIKLGLNGVGGKLVNEMLKHMEQRSSLITYGAMSRKPITLASSPLIFKQVKLMGFWMTKWYSENSLESRLNMYDQILTLMHNDNKFSNEFDKIDVKSINLDDNLSDILSTTKQFKNKKQIFVF